MPDEKDQAKRSVTERMMDQVQKVNTPEAQGAIKFIIHQAKEALTKPKEFFPAIIEQNSPGDARFFMLGAIALSSLIAGIFNMNLFVSIRFALVYFASAYITAFISWWLFMQFGSPKKFSENFIVVAYSQAALLLLALQLGPLRIVVFLAAVAYATYLQVIGMRLLHGLERNTIILVLALTALVLSVVRIFFDVY